MEPCPHCGELIAEDATRCQHCGSDEETGWNRDIEYHSIELPEPYDAVDQSETPDYPPMSMQKKRLILSLIAIGVGCLALFGGPLDSANTLFGIALITLGLVGLVNVRRG